MSHTLRIGNQFQTKSLPVWRRIRVEHDEPQILLTFARFSNIQDILRKYQPDLQYSLRDTLHNGQQIVEKALEPGPELFENQQVVFDYLVEKVYNTANVSSNHASCILVMDTGTGKTFMGGAFITHVKLKTLIILPNTTPLVEWLDMLTKSFPHARIGQYHSQAPHMDGDIVIMTVNSALKNTLQFAETISTSKYFEQFGAIIYDEIHSFPTVVRHNIFWRTNFRYALALTATPNERLDVMDKVAAYHLGPIITAKDIPEYSINEIKWTGLVELIYYSGPDEYTQQITNRRGWTQVVEMCKQFIADPYRNALILRKVVELYNDGANLIIFSEIYNYLEILQKSIRTALPKVAAKQIMILAGGSTPEDKHLAEDARITLTTFAYGTQSMSLPHANAILFATPRKNKMRQILGRVLRRSGDPSIKRRIVDIIDSKTKLKKQVSTRKSIYHEKGFEIAKTIVNFNKIKL